MNAIAEKIAISRSWDQAPDESIEAYQAFQIYLDMGESGGIRNYRKAFRIVNPTAKSVTKKWHTWFEKFRWEDRANDYDSYLIKQSQTKIEEQKIIEITKVRTEQLTRIKKSNKILFDLLELASECDDPKTALSNVKAITDALQTFMQMERQMLGMEPSKQTTEAKSAQNINILLGKLSDSGKTVLGAANVPRDLQTLPGSVINVSGDNGFGHDGVIEDPDQDSDRGSIDTQQDATDDLEGDLYTDL
jgi:hypothetical protein|tara:strand:- start:284 stop:1024 length:741 start_codon:yes stop_codon:yes gene_type:complete